MVRESAKAYQLTFTGAQAIITMLQASGRAAPAVVQETNVTGHVVGKRGHPKFTDID
jgi:hypothetical protein